MTLADQIGAASGKTFVIASRRRVGGGDINEAEQLVGQDGRRFFVKLNRTERLAMFEAEADGLNEIAATGTITVPGPVCTGIDGQRSFLVLDYLALDGRGDPAELGRQLAAMHRTTQPKFGWWRDNTIGATPQTNAQADDWPDFLRDRRLGFQLDLAERNGAPQRLIRQGERLLADLAVFFKGYEPVPALLHGDLWGGNYGYADGEPVLFDPAVYYGDREADLAMTELFGGFPSAFYEAYRAAWPVDPGYEVRKSLYNLYHILNHFNLFGGGYAGQAEHMVGRLLSEISGD
jgi:protein-ribulosamine 3-kinase